LNSAVLFCLTTCCKCFLAIGPAKKFWLLALQQPVAVHLRFILAASRINSDLEGIGDHSTNIAEDVIYVAAGRDVGTRLSTVGKRAEPKSCRSASAIGQNLGSRKSTFCESDSSEPFGKYRPLQEVQFASRITMRQEDWPSDADNRLRMQRNFCPSECVASAGMRNRQDS
jgi:hypothetical protein